MTINKKRLKRIIKEEMRKHLKEGDQDHNRAERIANKIFKQAKQTKEDEMPSVSVYVLWDILGGYDDSIFGIYSSPERAEAAKNAGQSEGKTTKFRIERLLLDPPTK
jgi:hypothetical protein